MEVHETGLCVRLLRFARSECTNPIFYPPRMREYDLNEHRKQRLADLVRDRFHGNEAELGRALGYADGSFVRQMLRDGPTARTVSEKTVYKIEALPGLANWFTNNPALRDDPPPTRGETQPARSNREPLLYVKSVPLLEPGSVHFMELDNSDPRFVGAPHTAAGSDRPGPRVKAIRVFDDSMAPAISVGDLVQLDPDLMPMPGQKILVRDQDGAFHLREYRRRSGGAFEAAANNPAHATLHSEADGLTIIAVATHLTQALR